MSKHPRCAKEICIFEKLTKPNINKYMSLINDVKSTGESISKAADIVIGTAKERMANPFISSLVISFICINWKPVLYIILSKKSIEEKFDYIKEEFYGEQYFGFDNVKMYFILPILFTLFYLIVLPYIMDLIEEKLNNVNIKKSDRQHVLNKRKYTDNVKIAEAEYEIEVARSGYKDRERLNLELKDALKNLNDEELLVKSLKEKNIIITEEYQTLSIEQNQKNLEYENLHKEFVLLNSSFRISKKEESALIQQVEDKNQIIANLNTNIQTSDKKLDDVKIELVSSKQIVAELLINNQTLVNDNQSSKTSINNLENQLNNFQQELQIKNTHITEQNSINSQLRIEIDILNTQKFNLQTGIENLQKENVIHYENINDLNVVNSTLKDEIETLNNNKVNLQIDIDGLHNDNITLHEKINELNNFEINLMALSENLTLISSKIPEIYSKDFYQFGDLNTYLANLTEFVSNLANEYMNPIRQAGNRKLIFNTNTTTTSILILQYLFPLSLNYGISILNLQNITEDTLEVILYSNKDTDFDNLIMDFKNYYNINFSVTYI